MTISSINEIPNNTLPIQKPIKEVMNINIPNIKTENIPQRNGGIVVLSGSGGSGKTNSLLNFFKSKDLYKNIFHNVWYICPNSSFLSVEKHPFENHDRVLHEIDATTLYEIYDTLESKKEKNVLKKRPIEYNCMIFDDYADILKDKSMIMALNKLLIKARHLNCTFFFTLQSYYYMPKILRKQITYCIIFKCKNVEEWYTLSKELLNMKSQDALILYKYLYDVPYAHLDIDTVSTTYYKNFIKLEINN